MDASCILPRSTPIIFSVPLGMVAVVVHEATEYQLVAKTLVTGSELNISHWKLLVANKLIHINPN